MSGLQRWFLERRYIPGSPDGQRVNTQAWPWSATAAVRKPDQHVLQKTCLQPSANPADAGKSVKQISQKNGALGADETPR